MMGYHYCMRMFAYDHSSCWLLIKINHLHRSREWSIIGNIKSECLPALAQLNLLFDPRSLNLITLHFAPKSRKDLIIVVNLHTFNNSMTQLWSEVLKSFYVFLNLCKVICETFQLINVCHLLMLHFNIHPCSEIVSVIVSLFSSLYVMKWREFFPHKELKYPPSFDGRAVCYPTREILRDYLAWRQVDCKYYIINVNLIPFFTLPRIFILHYCLILSAIMKI